MFSAQIPRTALISLPWEEPKRPAIALGLLKAVLHESNMPCSCYYLCDQFYEILEQMFGVPPKEIVNQITHAADKCLFDWLFSRSAFGYDVPGYVETYHTGQDSLYDMRDKFESLIDTLSEKPWDYDVIGFTCTMDQLMSSLALSRKIKKLNPQSIIALGGSIWDVESAQEIIKNCSWVDWIFLGETELLFRDVLRDFSSHIKNTAGLVTQFDDDSFQHSKVYLSSEEMNALPCPDYTEYFADRDSFDYLEMYVEGSRGCEYGDKIICSFCSLTVEATTRIRYKVLEDMQTLHEKYSVDCFEFVDRIVPKKVLLMLAENGSPCSFNLLLRVNTLRHQEIHYLDQLRAAGLRNIYIGIESLSTRLLKLMRKGQLAIECVEILQWAKFYGINIWWFILFAVPNEEPEDYIQMIELAKKIRHLSPPTCQPITISRGSPWHDELEGVVAKKVYDYVYPPRFKRENVAWYYDINSVEWMFDRLKTQKATNDFIEFLEGWRNNKSSELTLIGDTIFDSREPNMLHKITLTEVQKEILSHCAVVRKDHAILKKFNQRDLDFLIHHDLLLHLDRRFLSLVPPRKDLLSVDPHNEVTESESRESEENNALVPLHVL